MLSGYWLVKTLEDYMNYGKPPPNDGIVESSQTNDGIVESSQTNDNSICNSNDNSDNKIKIPSVHINTSLHGPIKQESNSNCKLTLKLLNKYLFDETTIIIDSVIY